MKKNFYLLIILLFSVTASIAQNQKMGYQAILRDSNNRLYVNGSNITLKWEVMNLSNNVIYSETHTGLSTNENGLLSLTLGDSTKGIGSFNAIEWNNARARTTITFNGNTIVSPAANVTAVPYALTSEKLNPTGSTMKDIYYTIDTVKTNIRNSVDNIRSNILAEMHSADSALQTHIDTTSANLRNVLKDTATVLRNELVTAIENFLNSDSIRHLTHDTANSLRTELATAIADFLTYDNIQKLVKDSLSHYATNAHLNDTLSYYAATIQHADTVKFSFHSDSSQTATFSTYADTALHLMNAQNSDTAKYAYHTDTATFALNTTNAVNAKYADTALYTRNADTTLYAFNTNTSKTATYADTALYLMNAQNSDTAKYAYHTDTATFALNTPNAINAKYADSAATADYNTLINKPVGINRGDILYWETSDSSWHVIPVGNVGEILSLDTNKIPHWISTTTSNLPTAITDSVIDITTNSARVVSTITDDGGSAFIFSGVCWDTTHNPTTASMHTLDGLGKGTITSYITGLTMGKTYYVRVFSTGNAGTAYGNELSFTTQTYPTVITNNVSNISVTTATAGGEVTDDGGAPVTERGVCWDTIPHPTIDDNRTYDGTGEGVFTSSLTSLKHSTTYYLRAYAINSVGTSYGNEEIFVTPTFPTVTTSQIDNIATTTATAGGEVTSDGGAAVTARGICWNTTGTPTLADNNTSDGNGLGSFTSNMTGLTPGTQYFVRSYAINAVDTSYGDERTFTTDWVCGAIIKDYDNNIYNTLLLGTQCWMKENLRAAHYSDGTSIEKGTTTSTTIAYIYAPNNDTSMVHTYGYLYNWVATMNGEISSSSNPSGVQGPCPTGWHVPSDAEWTQLTNYVSSQSQYWCGSNSTYITKALCLETSNWSTNSGTCTVGNTPANNNATGFGAPPAGQYIGSYSFYNTNATYWSSTESSTTDAYRRNFEYTNAYVVANTQVKYRGFSVRCLKD